MNDNEHELMDKNVFIKKYKVRPQGWKGRSLVTTIPRGVFEREARRLGLDIKEAIENLEAVWRYNASPKLTLTFEDSRTIVISNEEA